MTGLRKKLPPFSRGETILGLIILYFAVLFLRISGFKTPDYPANQTIKLTGRLSEEPYLKGSNQILTLGRIKVVTEPYPQFFYQDKIEVIGKLKEGLIKDKGNKFSLYTGKIYRLEDGDKLSLWSRIRRSLTIFRQDLESIFSRLLPEPQASLVSGILLGSRTNLPDNFLQDLRETGTIHLLAASGYNITVVAGSLISFLVWFFPRKKALPIAFLGIIIYTLMAGAGPAVVRAAIMGSLTYLAQFLGKQKDAVGGLLLSGVIMTLYNPLIIFDIGFQLSFGATAGIIFFLPLLEKCLIFQPRTIGHEAALTLAAQFGVLPILLYHFKTIFFFSPGLNVLLAPLVPPIMAFGMIVAFGAGFFLPIGKILVWPVWVLSTLMIKLITWFGRLSWGNLKLGEFRFWWGLVYYLFSVFLVLKIQKKTNVREK
ncbi:MAG: ComEC/Rec2 family competence protein [Candidatus Pacebacteria bacterium]|nr:ComEC/Rec2 family competence protein [Candidatus Paceibacterota bacterium]